MYLFHQLLEMVTSSWHFRIVPLQPEFLTVWAMSSQCSLELDVQIDLSLMWKVFVDENYSLKHNLKDSEIAFRN